MLSSRYSAKLLTMETPTTTEQSRGQNNNSMIHGHLSCFSQAKQLHIVEQIWPKIVHFVIKA